MIFTTASVNHTFTIPAGGLSCDILMIGGGGGGGTTGGGGGAGACIVAINQTLPAGTCVVYVGNGATGNVNGWDSFIQVGGADRYRAKGGGYAREWSGDGKNGGCGGGAGQNYNDGAINEGPYVGGTPVTTNVVSLSSTTTTTTGPTVTTNYVVMGQKGGNQQNTTQYGTQASYTGAGGGGIGQDGFNHANNDVNGAGGGNGRYFIDINGSQYNFRGYFANGSTSFGVQDGSTGNYYIGGGGGGNGLYGSSKPSGGLGGGGQGNYLNSGLGPVANATEGTANTGSGGGGGYGNGGNGSGGSGIIIIRYKNGTIPLQSTITTYTHTPTITTTLSTPTLGIPSIELVRGTQGDSNTDYKIGNYSGDFIIKSSVSNTDADYLKISSTGAITNPTGTASWNTGSDRRIKENIERASYDKCYESICRLELNRFNYIKGFNTVSRDNKQLGFIAQEVNDIFPKAITSQAYYSDVLNIPDLLSIDVSQINYSLYGAVKKLIEINNNKELRLQKLECLLNVDSASDDNVVIEDTMTSNVVVIEDTITSNIIVDSDVLSSNVVVIEDVLSSNVVIEDVLSSNVVVIEDTNNI